jgi:hypothetical protein
VERTLLARLVGVSIVPVMGVRVAVVGMVRHEFSVRFVLLV